MSFYKYLTIFFSIIMMNFSFAELKTFGLPTDSQEEESPTEEGTPEDGTPEDNMIRMIKGTPEEGAPEEGAPEEGTPEEGAPEEGAPEENNPEDNMEQDELPTISENNEINSDQPVEFKEEYVATVGIGSTIPLGTNLKNQFSGGLKFSGTLSTPFEFSGIKILGNFSMFTLKAEGDLSSNYTDYSVTSFGLNFNKKVSILDITLGTGLSIASGTAMYLPYDDYNMTTLYISGTLSYDLPISNLMSKVGQLENLNVSIAIGGMEIFGAPADEGTSDVIDFGLNVSYPFFF